MTVRRVTSLSLIEVLVLCAVLAIVGSLWIQHPTLAAILTLLIAAVIVAGLVRGRYQLRKAGYLVTSEGRDQIRYEEMAEGSVRHLIIDGEMLTGAPHVVYLPDREAWEKSMPAWARLRRDEIVERLRQALGTKRYQFEELRVRDT